MIYPFKPLCRNILTSLHVVLFVVLVLLQDAGAEENEPTFDFSTTALVYPEDSGYITIPNFITNFNANDAGQGILSYVTSNPSSRFFGAPPTIDDAGTLSFSTFNDAFGTVYVSVYAEDTGTENIRSSTQYFSIQLTPLDDPSYFSLASNPTVAEDSGSHVIQDMISLLVISDAGQSLDYYTVTATNPSAFTSGPSISNDGGLSFTLAPNADGDQEVSVTATDTGSNEGLHENTTAPKTFLIKITSENDPPVFSIAGDMIVPPTGVETTVANFMTGLDLVEPTQTATITLTPDNSALFIVPPAIDASGNLTFTLIEGTVGSTTIDVTVTDDGGGDDTTSSSFVLNSTYTGSYTLVDAAFDPSLYLSLGELNVASGETITIDTDTGTITGSATFTSAITEPDSGGKSYRIFNFDSINIATGATVTISGNTALALLSKNDFTIAADISRIGTNGAHNTTPATAGGTGGVLSLVAEGSLNISATVSVDGGIGGKGSSSSSLAGNNGGRGGNAGELTVSASDLVISGNLSAQGGNGGNGGSGAFIQGAGGSGGTGGTIVVAHTGTTSTSASVSAGSSGAGSGFGGFPFPGTITYLNTPDYIRTPAIGSGGLVSYWSFNVDARDAFGAHDGRFVGNASLGTDGSGFGGSGKAALVSDSSSYIDVAFPTKFDFNSSFTWHAYVKTTDLSGTIFGRNPYQGEFNRGSKSFYYRNGKTQFYAEDIGGGSALDRLHTGGGIWKQVIATYDSDTDTFRYYFEPTVANPNPSINLNLDVNLYDEHSAHGAGTADTDFTIGGSTVTSGWVSTDSLQGSYDEVAVFDTALTGADLLTLIESGPSAFITSNTPTFQLLGNVSVNEGSGANVIAGQAFNFDAADTGQILTEYIVTTADPSFFSVLPAIDENGKLSFTLVEDLHGSTSVTVQALDDGATNNASATQNFTLTVDVVDFAPTFTVGADQQIDEGSAAQTVASFISAAATNDPEQTLGAYTITVDGTQLFSSQPTISADGTLQYTPAMNQSGVATVHVWANDNGASNSQSVADQTFTITVSDIDFAPTFTVGSDQSVAEDSGAQTVASFISDGDAVDSDQSLLAYTVVATDTSLFSVQPQISANGTLSYTPAANQWGSTSVSVRANDNGATNNQSVALSTFTITVTSVNDIPVFSILGNQLVAENAGVQTVTGFASNFDPIDSGQSLVAYTATVTDGGQLFDSPAPSISSDGTLTFTAKPDTFGTAFVSVTATDDGTDNNLSAPLIFQIQMTEINYPPTFTIAGSQSADEDTGAQTAAAFVTNFDANDPGQTLQAYSVSNDNNSLFTAQPSIANDGTLTWTAKADTSGSATVSVTATDSGSSDSVSALQTFTITVNEVDDVPTFTVSNVTETEDPGAFTQPGFVSDFQTNDPAQSLVAYTLSNDNNDLFSSQPAIDNSGALSFTLVDNAVGLVTVTAFATDSGSANNQSTNETFTITVEAVDDPPTFTLVGDQTILEDLGAQEVSEFVSDFDAIDAGQSFSAYQISNDNNAFFTAQPALAADGTLTYAVAGNMSGSVTVTVTGIDTGATNNTTVKTFEINVTDINDRPEFSIKREQFTAPDNGPTTIQSFMTGLNVIESGQVATITVTNDNNALFSTQPSIDSSGTLSFTFVGGAFDQAIVTVTVADDGGTANGGIDSRTRTFEIYSTLSHTYDIAQAKFNPDAYPSLGSLILTSGQSIVIDPDAGTITGDATFTSTQTDIDSHEDRYRIFNFDVIDIPAGVTVTILGEMDLALLSLSDFTLGANLTRNGVNGADGGTVTTLGGDAPDGENGTDGEDISLVAEGHLTISSTITLNGGDGGAAGFLAIPGFPFVSRGDGGHGGDGGYLNLAAYDLTFTGNIIARGGDAGSAGEGFGSGRQGFPGSGGEVDISHTGTSGLDIDISSGQRDGHEPDLGDLYYEDTEVYIGTALNNFRSAYGLASDGSDDLLDVSGNGTANILYYAFGLGDPNSTTALARANADNGTIGLPGMSSDAVTLRYTYIRLKGGISGINYNVMRSLDMSVWVDVESLDLENLPQTETVVSIDENYEFVILEFQVNQSECFYHLEVTN